MRAGKEFPIIKAYEAVRWVPGKVTKQVHRLEWVFVPGHGFAPLDLRSLVVGRFLASGLLHQVGQAGFQNQQAGGQGSEGLR